MESTKTLAITDLSIFTTEVSNTEQEGLFGGVSYDPKTPNEYGYYKIPQQKYNCFKYYEKKWGGTFYKCYVDGKAPTGKGDPDSGSFVDIVVS